MRRGIEQFAREEAQAIAVENAEPYDFLDVDEFIRTAGDMPPYLVEDLIVDGTVSLIIGEPRTLKSMAAMNMAVGVALGTPTVIGFKIVRQGPVIYVLEEGSRFFVAKRLGAMLDAMEPSDRDFTRSHLKIFFRKGIKLDDEVSIARLNRNMEAIRPAFVVIDTFGRAFSGDENKKNEVQPALDNLERLAEAHDTAILLVHHANKDGKGSKTNRARGSGAIVASVQSTLYMEVETSGGLKVNRGKLEIESKDSGESRYNWTFDPETHLLSRAEDGPTTPTGPILAQLVATIETQGARASSRNLYDLWIERYKRPFTKSPWNDHIAKARSDGFIVQKGSGKTTHYTLPLKAPDPQIDMFLDTDDDEEWPE